LGKKYKAAVFDLDGTLRHSVPLGGDFFTQKVIELGFPVSEETHRATGYWEHYYWARSPELMRDSAKFDGDDDAFWSNYVKLRLEKLGANPEQVEAWTPQIGKNMREDYRPKDVAPSELYQILPALRSEGIKLGVLSNRRSSFMEIMEDLELKQFFDRIMFAGEVGNWKPDPKVFDPILTHFGLDPAEMVYIGDNYFADVVGSRNAGIEPVLYDPRGIFPEADCTRITSFEALPGLL
jgi:HAD superfamily hydrolase (TIGR01549 family)